MQTSIAITAVYVQPHGKSTQVGHTRTRSPRRQTSSSSRSSATVSLSSPLTPWRAEQHLFPSRSSRPLSSVFSFSTSRPPSLSVSLCRCSYPSTSASLSLFSRTPARKRSRQIREKSPQMGQGVRVGSSPPTPSRRLEMYRQSEADVQRRVERKTRLSVESSPTGRKCAVRTPDGFRGGEASRLRH